MKIGAPGTPRAQMETYGAQGKHQFGSQDTVQGKNILTERWQEPAGNRWLDNAGCHWPGPDSQCLGTAGVGAGIDGFFENWSSSPGGRSGAPTYSAKYWSSQQERRLRWRGMAKRRWGGHRLKQRAGMAGHSPVGRGEARREYAGRGAMRSRTQVWQ
ncbi:hypothetical protein GCM10022222_65070 [Amycolatopsis ultiminotia]|uniref:Uncharacterized protein n=1 Tax=Amycolatopsis ultiminotia TaxID=543629 RepID=A0ABP6XU91_9PSEU